MVSSISSQIQTYSTTNLVSSQPARPSPNPVTTTDTVNISEAARAKAKAQQNLISSEGENSSNVSILERDIHGLRNPGNFIGTLRGKISESYLMPATRADGGVHIEDIEAKTRDALGVFNKHLKKLFAKNDIDTSKEINISTNSSGKVIVTNDHPDKEKIEGIFENNDELANMYRGISSNMSFLKAAKEASAFQKAYAIDPKAAVENYSYLFNNNRDNASHLNINGNNLSFV